MPFPLDSRFRFGTERCANGPEVRAAHAKHAMLKERGILDRLLAACVYFRGR